VLHAADTVQSRSTRVAGTYSPPMIVLSRPRALYGGRQLGRARERGSGASNTTYTLKGEWHGVPPVSTMGACTHTHTRSWCVLASHTHSSTLSLPDLTRSRIVLTYSDMNLADGRRRTSPPAAMPPVRPREARRGKASDKHAGVKLCVAPLNLLERATHIDQQVHTVRA
jgi:hypothetical protein